MYDEQKAEDLICFFNFVLLATALSHQAWRNYHNLSWSRLGLIKKGLDKGSLIEGCPLDTAMEGLF
jgi:hypothetical protein